MSIILAKVTSNARVFVTIIFNLFAKIPILVLEGVLSCQMALQQREASSEHHLWQAEHLLSLVQEHLQLRFQFSHIKNTGQGLAKGNFSTCTFLFLLMISGYWVNNYLVQKSTKGCLRCMLKMKHVHHNLLEVKPGAWHGSSQAAWNKLSVTCELLLIFIGLLNPSIYSYVIIAATRGRVPFCCCFQTLSKAKGCFPSRINEGKHEYTD